VTLALQSDLPSLFGHLGALRRTVSVSFRNGGNVQDERLGLGVYHPATNALAFEHEEAMRKPRLLVLGTVVAGIVSVTAALIAGPTPSSEIEASASGGGHYLVGGSLDVQFAFSAVRCAVQYKDGHVEEERFTIAPMTGSA